MAVVYDSWFSNRPSDGRFGGPPLPSSWTRLARWRVPDRAELGADTVSFYSVDPAGTARLKRALADFELRLPPSVRILEAQP